MPYKVPFKEIAEQVDIYAVAKLLNITVVKNHADCPVCKSERGLTFFPDSNSFQCWSQGEKEKSDVISLYAHIEGVGMYQAAKFLQEQFLTAGAARVAPTTPTRPEGRTAAKAQPSSPQKREAFDAAAFASKLTYSDEVKALGITDEDAETFGIGHYRGKVYFPVRTATGFTAGFIGWADGILKLPPQWLEETSNVVALPKRRA